MSAFLELMQTLRRGEAVEDLGEKIQQMVDATIRTGKEGKLVLTLKCKLAEAGEVPQLEFVDGTRLTLPEPSRPATMMYRHKDGLSRRDPRQAEIPGLEDNGKTVKFLQKN